MEFRHIILILFVSSIAMVSYAQVKHQKAVFAGGCFWCLTPPFQKLDGVISVVSGYAGGVGKKPTYDDYAGKGYVEAIEITYDPSRISYEDLLDVFWRQINPTDPDGQFCDRGAQYRPVIFYENDDEKEIATRSRDALEKTGRFSKPVSAELIRNSSFYKAEDYHQDYYKKNPLQYRSYRSGCGRDEYLDEVWGKDKVKKNVYGSGA